MKAIVRPIPQSIADGLCLEKSTKVVNFEQVNLEHANYINLLKSIIGDNIIKLDQMDHLPDSCFVEDQIIVIDNKICLNQSKPESRKLEIECFRKFFKDDFKYLMYEMKQIDPEAYCDGGDALYVECCNTLFIGITGRTNLAAAKCLKSIFNHVNIVPIYLKFGLHLKSYITFFAATDSMIYFAVYDVCKIIDQFNDNNYTGFKFEFIKVPDQECCNVLSINLQPKQYDIIIKSGYPNSAIIYETIKSQIFNVKINLYYLEYNETAKIDGSLTCSSVLFN